MSHVFISYTRPDQQFVRQLYADLEANGVNTWVDLYDIAPGEEWNSELKQALDNAYAIVVVVSHNSMASEELKVDLWIALHNGLPIIPIVIEPAEMFSTLTSRQSIDFQGDLYESGLTTLLNTLREHDNSKPDETVLSPTTTYTQAKSTPEPSNKGYAFLSYISKDADFVDRFKSFLKDRGYAFWDYRESERDYGLELYRELEAKIENAAVFVSVLSDAWRDSLWTARELTYAEEAKVPVFVLQAKPLKRPVPILLNLRTRIDMATDYEAGVVILGEEFDKKGL